MPDSEVKVPEEARDYRPSREHLSNGEIESTGILCGGAVYNIARELLAKRVQLARVEQERDQLRASLQEHCVVMEYDYTGYVAEPCGYYCRLCHCPVNDDKVTGHRKDCLLNGGHAPVVADSERLRASHAELMDKVKEADANLEDQEYQIGVGNIGRVRLILQQAIKRGSQVQAGNGSSV